MFQNEGDVLMSVVLSVREPRVAPNFFKLYRMKILDPVSLVRATLSVSSLISHPRHAHACVKGVSVARVDTDTWLLLKCPCFRD